MRHAMTKKSIPSTRLQPSKPKIGRREAMLIIATTLLTAPTKQLTPTADLVADSAELSSSILGQYHAIAPPNPSSPVFHLPYSFLTTSPPFITNFTRSRVVTSFSGSASTATMSAQAPGSSVPTLPLQPNKSAAFTVEA